MYVCLDRNLVFRCRSTSINSLPPSLVSITPWVWHCHCIFWHQDLLDCNFVFVVYIIQCLPRQQVAPLRNPSNKELSQQWNENLFKQLFCPISKFCLFPCQNFSDVVCLFPLLFTVFISQPFSFRLFPVCESPFLISLFVYYSLWVYVLIWRNIDLTYIKLNPWILEKWNFWMQ